LKDVEDFTMIFQAFIKDMVKVLSPAGCKVILKFFSLMQYSSHIGIDQKTLAEELELSIRSINGAIKELLNMSVIIGYADPQDRRRQVYIVNPHGAWKGDLNKRKKVLKDNPNQYKMFAEHDKTTEHSLL
jgi:DNA-binding MarR family transcriptional regulator